MRKLCVTIQLNWNVLYFSVIQFLLVRSVSLSLALSVTRIHSMRFTRFLLSISFFLDPLHTNTIATKMCLYNSFFFVSIHFIGFHSKRYTINISKTIFSSVSFYLEHFMHMVATKFSLSFHLQTHYFRLVIAVQWKFMQNSSFFSSLYLLLFFCCALCAVLHLLWIYTHQKKIFLLLPCFFFFTLLCVFFYFFS